MRRAVSAPGCGHGTPLPLAAHGGRHSAWVTQDPCYTGAVANLTLTIDDELLRRARVRAAKENTSVNAVVREYLAAYSGARQVAAARRRFVEISQASSSGSGPGGRSWRRDELHDR